MYGIHIWSILKCKKDITGWIARNLYVRVSRPSPSKFQTLNFITVTKTTNKYDSKALEKYNVYTFASRFHNSLAMKRRDYFLTLFL